MAEEMKVIPPYPNELALSMTGARKAHSGLHGSPRHGTIAELESLGVQIPANAGPADLDRLLFEHRTKSGSGLTKQDLLDSRGRNAWNLLTQKWAKSLVRKGRPLPMHLCKTHGYGEADCNAIDEQLHELDIDEDAEANTPDWAKAYKVLEANLKTAFAAHNALEARVAALTEVVIHLLENSPLPAVNALAARIRLVVDNTAAPETAA